jgi:hypothetical protein
VRLCEERTDLDGKVLDQLHWIFVWLLVDESDLEHDNFCKMICFIFVDYQDRLTRISGFVFEVELHSFESIVPWGQLIV